MPIDVGPANASGQSIKGSNKSEDADAAFEPPVKSVKPWLAPFPRLEEPRVELVGHLRSLLFDGENPHRLVSLTGPHGIGKSGLVRLFQLQLDRDDVDYAWHKVDYARVPEGIEPLRPVVFAMRRDARIDLTERRTDLLPATPTTMHVVILDDAHRILEETWFWSALVTAIHSWLPPNVRFIVAATTSATAPELPRMLKEFPSIQQDAFVLLDDRAQVYLMDESKDKDGKTRGKLMRWPFKPEALADVLIRAANGSIGVLEMLVYAILAGGVSSSVRSESALVRKFFTKSMSKSMADAFKIDGTASHSRFDYAWGWTQKMELPLTSVNRCFALEAQGLAFASADEELKISDLERLGLVKLTPDGATDTSDSARYRLEFTSPCAKRLAMAFASDGSGEESKMRLPTTLSSLVKSLLKMIGVVEPAVASASMVTSFYERFIEALARRRNPTSEIYPELLDVLPSAASEMDACSHDGHLNGTTIEIDVCYVLDQRTRWGLQVRITGQDPRTLTAPVRRFPAGQRYGLLRVDDFVEVDIVLARVNAEQEPPGSKKRMVVCFDPAQGRFKVFGGGAKRCGPKRPKRA